MLAEIIPIRAVEPDLEELRAFRGIHALCTVERGKKRLLKATHYASVLIGGPRPVWGVWTVAGKFLRFYGSRHEIERAYPKLVWRRHMATWQCISTEDKNIAKRRMELETTYGKKLS